MEIDQLKAIWKDADKSATPMNEAGLHQILTHSSKLPIAIMKRNLRLEFFFFIIIYGYSIWLILNEFNTSLLYFDLILLIVTAIPYTIYARYKYKLLNNMECMSCVVKSNLDHQVNSLEKLIKLCFKAGNIIVILVYLITGAVSYMNSVGESVPLPKNIEILIFIAIGSVLVITNYYFGRWYLFNLYGKHIQKLKNILYEMDESD